MALKPSAPTSCCRRWRTNRARRQPDRLQRARRAHGLAAVGAAAEHQPAAPGGAGPRGRSVAGRVHRRQPEKRLAGLRCRAAGQSAELPAQPALPGAQPAGLPVRHEYMLKYLLAPKRHSGERSGAAGRCDACRKWNGASGGEGKLDRW
ncbi:hypothetical protein M8494_07175 [Serratia ureilytica]